MPTPCRNALIPVLFFLISVMAGMARSDVLSMEVEWLKDVTGNQSLADIIDLPAEHWQRLPDAHILNPGYNTAAWWLKVTPRVGPADIRQAVLEIAFPMLDYVDVFVVPPASRQPRTHWSTGDHLPFNTRPVAFENFAFPVSRLDNGTWPVLYVRIQSTGGVQIPVQLHSTAEFVRHASLTSTLNSLYYGTLGIIAIINLLLFWQIREERAFLHYALTTLGLLLLIASMQGSLFRYVLPNHPDLYQDALLAGIFATLSALSAFTRHFLNLQVHAPQMALFYRVTQQAALFFLLLIPFLEYQILNLVGVFLAGLTLVPMLFTGPVCWLRGVPRAPLYTLATGILACGALITTLANLALIPATLWSRYAIQVSSAVDAVMLTVALAMRMGDEHRERDAHQAAAERSRAAQQAAQKELRRASLMDDSVDLPNAHLLRSRLQSEHRQRVAGGLVLLRIPQLNSLGTILGPEFLAEARTALVARLSALLSRENAIRPVVGPDLNRSYPLASVDTACFAALLHAGRRLPESRLRYWISEIEKPIVIHDRPVRFSLQAGIVVPESAPRDPDQWLHCAQWACDTLSDNQSGFSAYTGEVLALHQRRQHIVQALEPALHNRELRLYYQPQLNLMTQRVEGVEALLRWHHPDIGTVPPDELVSIAIQTGLIRPLTQWVIQQGLHDLVILREHAPWLRLSVNVSARNLEEWDFSTTVLESLTRFRLPASCLCIEITETESFIAPDQARQALDRLHEAGVQISMDDFGTGYSNLAQLSSLRLTELKVDRSLTRIDGDTRRYQVLSKTISMGKVLECSVVAEGVEDQAQLKQLHALGCDLIQGYYLHRPEPLEATAQWLRDFDPWAFGLQKKA